MAQIHLIRHGQASAGFDTDRDPGLDDMGRAQAVLAASGIATKGPLPILVSPLLRCRETAAPLEALWEVEATVEPAVAEVVAPTDDLAGRGEWLRTAMAGTWSELEPEPRAWRDRLLRRIGAIDVDTVVVTHFIAINAVIGAATDDDRVMIARLANGTRTVVDNGPDGLTLVSTGTMGASEVL